MTSVLQLDTADANNPDVFAADSVTASDNNFCRAAWSYSLVIFSLFTYYIARRKFFSISYEFDYTAFIVISYESLIVRSMIFSFLILFISLTSVSDV